MSEAEKVASVEAETAPSALPKESDDDHSKGSGIFPDDHSNGSGLIPDDVEISAHDGGVILPGVTTGSRHYLMSSSRGESVIERLARKIETRRENRLSVTKEIRKQFLKICRDIAREKALKNKIPIEDLVKLRDEYKQRVESGDFAMKSQRTTFTTAFGFWDKDKVMLSLFERGVENAERIDAKWFFFRDFNFYHTIIKPRMNIFGNAKTAVLAWLFIFYLCSAVFFCAIIQDENVCPSGDHSYDGWLTSVYFASVTMSTVGYGYVSLARGEAATWRVFIGALYMLVALLVGYTVFVSAADLALGGLDIGGSGRVTSVLFRPCVDSYDGDVPLYQQVRRVVKVRVLELVTFFFLLNLVGVFASRIFVYYTDAEDEQWTWMDSFYWAIQTTTTVGYGDLVMPFQLRWFNIFFTTLGTAFVGSVFGGMASLKSDVADLRRFYAWKRREVSKRMIEDMKGTNSDHQLDQFEFLVGSLIMLNKIETSDIEQIMDKFRELAGSNGYVTYSDAEKEAENSEKLTAAEEEAEDADMDLDVDAAGTRF